MKSLINNVFPLNQTEVGTSAKICSKTWLCKWVCSPGLAIRQDAFRHSLEDNRVMIEYKSHTSIFNTKEEFILIPSIRPMNPESLEEGFWSSYVVFNKSGRKNYFKWGIGCNGGGYKISKDLYARAREYAVGALDPDSVFNMYELVKLLSEESGPEPRYFIKSWNEALGKKLTLKNIK